MQHPRIGISEFTARLGGDPRHFSGSLQRGQLSGSVTTGDSKETNGRFTLRAHTTCTCVRPFGVNASDIETNLHNAGFAISAT